jgi:Zn-dependent protease with chaperone function
MSVPSAGPMLVMAGLAIIAIGLLVWWGAFGWFGHLPGDIRIERENVRVYVPIVSMLVISIVLTILLNLISRFF